MQELLRSIQEQLWIRARPKPVWQQFPVPVYVHAKKDEKLGMKRRKSNAQTNRVILHNSERRAKAIWKNPALQNSLRSTSLLKKMHMRCTYTGNSTPYSEDRNGACVNWRRTKIQGSKSYLGEIELLFNPYYLHTCTSVFAANFKRPSSSFFSLCSTSGAYTHACVVHVNKHSA